MTLVLVAVCVLIAGRLAALEFPYWPLFLIVAVLILVLLDDD